MSTTIPYSHHHDHDDGTGHDDSHEHHVQPAHSPPHSHSAHAAHAHPHPHPSHGHPVKKSGWQKWWGLVVGLVAVATVAGIWWSKVEEEQLADPKHGSAALIAQMKAASEGWVEGTNSFGGKIKSEEGNGKHAVTVTGIPNKPCVEASWALAREGQITVNGVFLPRISAGKLAELCSNGDNNSTLIWSPK